MTLAEIIAQTRLRTFDTVEPYLFSDAEIIEFANDAQNEACRRARLIVDSTTKAVCSISLSAAKKVYDLDARVIFIRRAKVAGEAYPLRRMSYRDLDRIAPDWQDEAGTPKAYVPDMDTGKLRPYPSPDAIATVALTVVRLPLVEMADMTDEPEINQRWHKSLINWILFRAYSKPDTDLQDPKRAQDGLALFEQEFGKKSTAIDEAWIEREHGYTDEEGVY